MKDTALYPGTFDPVTLGHVDIIRRATRLFDKLVVAVADNPEKQSLFTVKERVKLLEQATGDIEKATVTSFGELTAKFARSIGAAAIIRGIRAISDFEFEFQMALMNRKIEPDVETVYLMPTDKYSYLSSSLVKDIARRGGDVSCFVPPDVLEALEKRFSS
ncbi:MAG: pantetheine-phosphate adenylyltransferase [candidate division Zixibacteria bacterium]